MGTIKGEDPAMRLAGFFWHEPLITPLGQAINLFDYPEPWQADVKPRLGIGSIE
jgi:hypothetical protein